MVGFGNGCFERTSLTDCFSNGVCGGGVASWVGFETVVRADGRQWRCKGMGNGAMSERAVRRCERGVGE